MRISVLEPSFSPSRPLVVGLSVFVLFGLVGHANALPMPGPLVYEEGYNGEVGFALSPDLDAIGSGGMSPLLTGNGPPAAPSLSATTADIVLSAAPGSLPSERVSTAVGGGAIGAFDVGLRGEFDDLALTAIGSDAHTSSNIVALYTGVAVSSTFFFQVVGGSTSAGIVVLETDLGSGSQTAGGTLLLSAPDIALVAGGASYRLDLVVDRGAGTAWSEVAITGGGTYASGPLALGLVGGSLLGATQDQLLGNSFAAGGGTDWGTDDAASVRFDNFQIYSPVPEPSTGLLVMAGLAGMAVRRRTT